MSLDNLTPTEFTKWFQLGQSVRRMMGKGDGEWEVLYEGTVETAFSEAGTAIHGASCFFLNDLNSALFNQGETIRLTVDEVSKIFTAEMFTTGAYVGNAWLMTDSDRVATDTGYDFAVSASAIITLFSGVFYSREAGIYNIKIERTVS